VLLFRLVEYARAEKAFVSEAIHALSVARGGIVGLIRRETAPRTGTTQFTTDEGTTVELAPGAIEMPMKLPWEDVISGKTEAFITSLDEAAAKHHEELSKYIFESLETVTSTTGNQVDATGKSFFEYMYEMFEKVELSFESDGSISHS
jgi:hypothetical protein